MKLATERLSPAAPSDAAVTDRSLPDERARELAPREVPRAPDYSIVVPLYNEAEVIDELYSRLVAEMTRRGGTYEMVFVDDGSRDGTFERLAALYGRDPDHVRVVRLRRNFGQTAGLAAGIDHARGAVVITMDGDLQHDPADLPKFFARLDEGYELVSGWREHRVDNLVLRQVPSRVANWLMARLSGVALHDFGTTFKAYRREILEGLELHGELHRFVPALLSWQGVRMAEVPIRNVPRAHGKSNYGITRTFRVFFDLLTVKFLISYISRPLHVFGMLGGALFGGGLLIALVLTVLYYAGQIVMKDHLGNLMFSMLLMMLGVQLVAMGLTLEVGIRTYHAASRRRIYAVRQVLWREAGSRGD